jgi:uncharacterized protein with von Willebrand factor type A (vWA) domain
MVFRYSEWDGTQSIPPLDPDDLLDELSRDLLEEGDLRRALERLLMRGMERRNGQGRRPGMRDMFDRLRQRRDQQLSRFDLSSFMDDIAERLDDIIDKEQDGIDRLESPDGPQATDDPDMRRMAQQLAQRKREAMDALPDDIPGRLERLMDYEFIDQEARQEFQELVNELREKMLGEQFRQMQEALERMSAEDLEPLREMMQALNQLLAKHARGAATEQDFQEFMSQFGHFFPPDIQNIDDLVNYLERQAQMMASLMMSMPEDMRRELQQMMQALLQDSQLQYDMMEMASLLEQITGRPLGQRFPFSGDEPVDFNEAMDMMRGLNDIDELERQLREAMRDLNFDNVNRDLMQELLGREAEATLEEFRRIARMLEEQGLARRDGNDISLTAKGMRRLGERALQDLFAELRKDRAGQHDDKSRGASSEQTPDTKQWEFGDPFLVDIGASISNAVRRNGPGLPVKIEPDDLEVHRTEALITSSTVIVMDMSRSMFNNGAFFEAKRVALALNTLIKTRYPRDYLDLVVFSYFAMQLDPDRLLQSDWVDWSGTNIEAGIIKARQLLSKRAAANRQIILITDWRPRPVWGPYGDEGTVEGLLREVKHCTQSGIRINTFMMGADPTSMALAQAMMRINKGRAFFGSPNRIGRYVLVDYLKHKKKAL